MGAADEVFPALDRIEHAARMSLLFVEKFSIDMWHRICIAAVIESEVSGQFET